LAEEFHLKNKKGVLVSEVEAGGPAEDAHIKRGDVIFEVEGFKVDSPEKLSYRIAMSPVDKKVKIGYWRDGKEHWVEVKLKQRQDERKLPRLGKKTHHNKWGFKLSNTQQKGLLIERIEPGSPAESSTLRPGDIIVEVNHREIKNLHEFQKADTKKNKILLRIARGDYYFFITLKK